MMKLSHLMIAALMVMPLMGSGSAQATGIGKILDNSGLTPSDIEIMEDSAHRLLEPLGRTGDVQSWSNSNSQSKGEVVLGRIEENCAELVYRLKTLKRPKTLTYRTWRCRKEDEKWQPSSAPN